MGLGQAHRRVCLHAGCLRHRGPDGQVSWAEGGIILTQTRLAIIDVPTGVPSRSILGMGASPSSTTARYTTTRVAHPATPWPPGSCDGAMLPELWAKLGPACPSELRGMFAICVFDRLDRRMWLAVDPLGMKPSMFGVGPLKWRSSRPCPLAQHFRRFRTGGRRPGDL